MNKCFMECLKQKKQLALIIINVILTVLEEEKHKPNVSIQMQLLGLLQQCCLSQMFQFAEIIVIYFIIFAFFSLSLLFCHKL